jgi:LuxR family maltose regulon positive regulatory protein
VVASAAGRLEGFTKRELVALSMLVKYASNEQIAAAMFVTKDTLKYHLKNIYGKLGVSTRLEAIRVALDLGLK